MFFVIVRAKPLARILDFLTEVLTVALDLALFNFRLFDDYGAVPIYLLDDYGAVPIYLLADYGAVYIDRPLICYFGVYGYDVSFMVVLIFFDVDFESRCIMNRTGPSDVTGRD